jgi:hypothetical protein
MTLQSQFVLVKIEAEDGRNIKYGLSQYPTLLKNVPPLSIAAQCKFLFYKI